MRELFNDGDISEHDQAKFYRSVRAFYERAMEYALLNLPLEDALLQNAGFVNFHVRETATFQQVEYFVERFGALLPFQSPREMDVLLDEFVEYQLLQDDDIPSDVWDKASIVIDDDTTYHRMDIVWHHISTLKAPDSRLRFSRLSKVAMLVLIIPHSNAEEERVFSMVRKNKTAFRPALDPKGTLSSILTIKLAHTEAAHQFEPNKELLKTAKSATRVYNRAHCSK